jgi:hypothetical protein
MTQQTVEYRNFIISWPEPPIFSGLWSADVATNDRALHAAMIRQNGGAQGATVIEGSTREEMLAKARSFIDQVHGAR